MGEDNRKEFISRIGTFFLLIGIGMMWLFVVSDMSNSTNFIFFVLSIVTLVTGWYFKRIAAPPPKAGSRFEALRRMMQKQREAKAKKEADKKN
jgi:hypothetical protein